MGGELDENFENQFNLVILLICMKMKFIWLPTISTM